MYTLKYIKFYLLFIIFFLLSACSTITEKNPSSHSTKRFDTNLQKGLEARIEQSRIVYIGESHNQYGHHLNQLDIIQVMHKKWGGGLSIGLEMIQQPFQSYLDEYIDGTINEREMLHGTQWYSRWRFDFRLYRPIFDYARQHRIPLIALNIPQEVTKQIAKNGIASLSKEHRKFLPTLIDKSDDEYTNRLKEIFGKHAHGKTFNEKGFQKFVEAQLGWDEGMAFAASKYLKATENSKKHLAILAGSGHLINRSGIPNRLARQLSQEGVKQSDMQSVVVLSHSDKVYTNTEADFSIKSQDIELEPAGVLGLHMKDSDKGVIISKLSELGGAKQAGLQENDVILKLNKTDIKTVSDVSLWRLDKKPNDKVIMKYRRGEHTLDTELILGSLIKSIH